MQTYEQIIRTLQGASLSLCMAIIYCTNTFRLILALPVRYPQYLLTLMSVFISCLILLISTFVKVTSLQLLMKSIGGKLLLLENKITLKLLFSYYFCCTGRPKVYLLLGICIV